MSSTSSTTRHGGGTNKKGYFSLKSKELASQPARKPASQSHGNYGRMLVLGKGRPGAPSSSSRSKMAVPKPVNLPSKRSEAGNLTPLAPGTQAVPSSWNVPRDEAVEAEQTGPATRATWGDSPAPARDQEFPALGTEEEPGSKHERGGNGARGADVRYGGTSNTSAGAYHDRYERNNEYDRNREWGGPRGGGGGGDRYGRSPDERGGWYTGQRSMSPNSPPRVEPGAIMIKKRSEQPVAQQQPKQQPKDQNSGPLENKKTEMGKVDTNEDDEDDDVFTPDQGKIIWSLEEDEMDFSRPLRFGDEEEDESEPQPPPVEVAEEAPSAEPAAAAAEPVAEEEENSSRWGDKPAPEEEDATQTTKESAAEATVLAEEDTRTPEEIEEEERQLEERRRQIAARREEELRRMRELEEERIRRRHELDRLRREEDARREAEEEEQVQRRRAAAAERSANEYGRGPSRGEPRTLFNPKDPDRPIVVKPGEQTPAAANSTKRSQSSKAERRNNSNNNRERPPRDNFEASMTAAERDVPYRSSRSLVAPDGVIVEKRAPREKRNKKNKKGGDNKGESGKKEKKEAPVVEPPAPVVEQPVMPETPAWDKVEGPKVKTLAEIQLEEQQREKEAAEAAAKRQAAKKEQGKDKKKKEAKEKKANNRKKKDEKPQNNKKAANASKSNKKNNNSGDAESHKSRSAPVKSTMVAPAPSTVPMTTTAAFPGMVEPSSGGLSSLAPLMSPLDPVAAPAAKPQQRRLFERGPEDDDVIDTFHLERSIDAVTEEASSVAPSHSNVVSAGGGPAAAPEASSANAAGSVASSGNSTRFSESAIAASAFQPGKYGGALAPLPASFQSTWAPQTTSQIESDSLYPAAAPASSAASESRYTGLFGTPSPASSTPSPFASSFGAPYGGVQWGTNEPKPASTAGASYPPQAREAAPQPSTNQSSRFFPSPVAPPTTVSEDSWTSSSSVFALPTHIMAPETSSRPPSAARQPLVNPSADPEEFGKFLERATFTPQSMQQFGQVTPLSAAGPSIGGKPLSTIAASPPAYIMDQVPSPNNAPEQPQQQQPRSGGAQGGSNKGKKEGGSRGNKKQANYKGAKKGATNAPKVDSK